MAFKVVFFLKQNKHRIAHFLGDALKITGDKYRPFAIGGFECQRFHPDVMQLSIRRALRTIPCKPYAFFRCDNSLSDTRLPRSFTFLRYPLC